MGFGSASSLAAFYRAEPCVTVCGHVLKPSRATKYLGVWLSEDLSWARHARMLTGRCYSALRTLARLRSALTISARILLVRSLALVHLQYCNTVLTGADQRTMSFLRVAQNSCVRFIYNLPRRSPVSPSRRLLGLLRPSDSVRVRSLSLLHTVVHHHRPLGLAETLSLTPGSTFRRGRSATALKFVLPRAPSTSFTLSFRFSVVREWNRLPAHLRSLSRHGEFVRSLTAYYLGPGTSTQP